MDIHFEWDARKAALNLRKHGVSFNEAKEIFFDNAARLLADPDHSADEDRFVMLGMSRRARLLVVCHCYRKSDDVIRIISARRANQVERGQYF